MGTIKISRRNFLKASASSAFGIVLAGGGMRKILAAPEGAWKDGMQINPDIDNFHVVCCYDPKMLRAAMTDLSALGQNTPVDKERLQRNMDSMARALVREKKPAATAEEAWKTILGSSKPWNQTRAAIKVDCLEPRNAPRIAILDKLGQVLMNFGVPAQNITIYDAVTSATRV